jgi:hypothetical protein
MALTQYLLAANSSDLDFCITICICLQNKPFKAEEVNRNEPSSFPDLAAAETEIYF